ncbi:MAG: hypothetical protein KH275_09995 [Clostridiales bacterium]|uniref:DUF2383 domain-containing protein n=1 Tax=Candidatus Pullilachnospira stercoravium TaxID=2840913 RepID=A0A9D1T7C5_9FIRM|nr:hypothetical protein [Clostridiales bacterium]HIV14277.1 hypothetical protein [Candidatus Pullilachnospira stercoravium]
MNGNAELLNFVYQNAEMGVNTMKQIIDLVEEDGMKEHLRNQLVNYEDFQQEARKLLNENGYDEKGISALDRLKTYLMINMQTMADSSSSHIAKMLITGSNMGIVEAAQNLKKYAHADKDAVKLMERLMKTEEKNVQELKQYL